MLSSGDMSDTVGIPQNSDMAIRGFEVAFFYIYLN